MSAVEFYDGLAPLYHLVYENWEASIERQGKALDAIIRSCLGETPQSILDVACGIGTQCLGLAALGHRLTCSDLSPAAVQRARREASARGMSIDFTVADMRASNDHQKRDFDVVLCADNSLPHLLSDEEITVALRQFLAALKPGGLCLISVRDYARVERGGIQVKQHGVRTEKGKRWILFQLWEWRGPIYDLHFYFVADDVQSSCVTHVFRSCYYAVSIEHLIQLMVSVGFEQVRRIDDVFFQPVIAGRRQLVA
jgi:SAM-dependent methyltransferase